MKSIDDEVIVVIRRLAKTIKRVGVKKVVAALDELNTKEGFIDAHRNLIKFILKETSISFQVNPEDLNRKNKRVSNLNYDIRVDRKFMDIYKEVDRKVEERKNVLWLKHS